tara:strand:+ start:1932 stop:3257 length:1326 start_codon:yes stop_codon:yes gene_type:complete
MDIVLARFKMIWNSLTGKIAFYPALLAIFGLTFGFIMLYAEERGISKFLIENAPNLVINNADTARTLLSTFVGGIISLMVFSFSMVMILLNQASNNYSPRILPGLISNKRHQLVLGFYIATLTYNILILLSIKPTDDKYQLPGFSVLIGILMGMIVLALFIYFIHAISEAIQINNIIKSIYLKTQARLNKLIKETDDTGYNDDFPNTDDWNTYSIDRTGYLQNIAIASLIKLCEKDDLKFDILITKGTFILEGLPVAKCNKELDEEQQKNLMACFGFSSSEIVDNNYILGFKQLNEIAIKAMSPGINDPGTAITCLDYMTQLFNLRLQKKDYNLVHNDKKEAIISLRPIQFSELIYFVYAPLRTYCKQDIIMLNKMLHSLYFLERSSYITSDYKKLIVDQVNLIITDIKNNIVNEEDLNRLLAIGHKVEKYNDTKINVMES